jgi:hypothetical protein
MILRIAMARDTARHLPFEADVQAAINAAMTKHGVEPVTVEYALFWSLIYLLAGFPDGMRQQHTAALAKALPEQVETVRRVEGLGEE